jgi:hypothetical protein
MSAYGDTQVRDLRNCIALRIRKYTIILTMNKPVVPTDRDSGSLLSNTDATPSGFAMPQDTYLGPSIGILNNVPPEALKVIPFVAPPPGVVLNFEHPTYRVPIILGVSIAFFVIATLCLGIRIHTKLAIEKKWR